MTDIEKLIQDYDSHKDGSYTKLRVALEQGQKAIAELKTAKLDSARLIVQEEMYEKLKSEAIKILEDAKETIEYCQLYVENRGLSADDDCNISLKLINDFLEAINEKRA